VVTLSQDEVVEIVEEEVEKFTNVEESRVERSDSFLNKHYVWFYEIFDGVVVFVLILRLLVLLLGFVHFLFELDLLSLRILSEGDKT
jgi:hypothetical protein